MPPRLTAGRRGRIFMSADAVGGVWTYVLQLARGLGASGMSVRVAVLGPPPSSSQIRQAERIAGLEIECTGLPLDWTAQQEAELDTVARELGAMSAKFKADLVHLNAPAHAGAEHWPVPLVVAAHSCVATWWRAHHNASLPVEFAWRRRRTSAGLAVADAVISPSRSFADQLASEYGSGICIAPVWNAVDRAAERGGVDARSIVLTAGRLWDAAKNVATIDAAAALGELTVHAAGATRGPNGEQIGLRHVNALGELGPVEMGQWLERAAIFVSASRYEPFGLAVLEAAQAGAALVLSDIPTFRELWDGAAVFVPADDASALADAVLRLQRDDAWRRSMAAAAGERSDRYAPRRMIGATLSVYSYARWAHAQRVSTECEQTRCASSTSRTPSCPVGTTAMRTFSAACWANSSRAATR